MSRTTLTLALLVLTLLAGCTGTVPGPPTTDTAVSTTTPLSPGTTEPGTAPDEPPLDFDDAAATLGSNDQPYTVRLVNEGEETRNVTLTVARDGTTVYEQTFRSFPNTTVLGELDHVGNYTLTVSVLDSGATVTETLAASSFDCNQSTTVFDLTDPDPTVETSTTEMACGTTTG